MKAIMWVIVIVAVLIGIAGLACFTAGKWIPAAIYFGVFAVLVVVFGIGGLKRVHQEERMVIEFFGKFYGVKKPGLRWVCPFVMKVRAVVSIWEQVLPLFEEPIKVDFRDGSATPKGVRAFVRVKDPGTLYVLPGEKIKREGVFRVIYYIDNWRKRTVDLLENAVRSYLATLTIDEALPKKRGGYDLLTANRIPKEEKEKIKETLERWGLILERITVTDFDLDPEIIRARAEVQKRKRAVETADQEKKVRAKETVGALVQMIAESTGRAPGKIQEEINNNPELKRRFFAFSEELITRQMSIDGKALTDVRTQGSGDLFQSILTLIAAAKTIPGSREGGKKE